MAIETNVPIAFLRLLFYRNGTRKRNAILLNTVRDRYRKNILLYDKPFSSADRNGQQSDYEISTFVE